MKHNITIIILHYNHWQTTANCLDSVSKITHSNFNYKVILINNSLKKIPSHLVHEFNRKVDLLLTPDKNLGFADGNNFAIANSAKFNPDYYLFLNNDTIVESDFLEKLLANLPKKNCLAGPILEHKVKNKTYYDYGGFINWEKTQAKHINLTKNPLFQEGQRIPDCKSRIAGVCDKASSNAFPSKSTQTPQIRDFVSGCCLLVSRKIIDIIGGFRSDYFLYLEDVELCLRATKHNFPTYIIPSSKIFHLGSQSSREFTKIFYSLKNSLKLISEYTPAKYQLSSYLFNLFFYPSIFLLWQLKKLKHKLF